MTEQIELQNKIDKITTWLETEEMVNHEKGAWLNNSWTFAIEEYNETQTKSVVTQTISQMSKAAKRYNIASYPLASRSTSSMTQEMQDLVLAHQPFVDAMCVAFDSLPENHAIRSKKSTARPDRRYLNTNDWKQHWLDYIISNIKEDAKESTQ
jgi:hypothetical protein